MIYYLHAFLIGNCNYADIENNPVDKVKKILRKNNGDIMQILYSAAKESL